MTFKNNKLFGKSSLFGRNSLFSGNSLFPASSDLPIAGMSERYFTGSGIVGNEVVNPYGDNAQFVKSYCAHFNGTNSECALGTALNMAQDWTILIDFIGGSVIDSYLLSEVITTPSVVRFYIKTYQLQMGTSSLTNIFSAPTENKRYIMRLRYNHTTGVVTSKRLNEAGTDETGTEYTVAGLTATNQTFRIGRAPTAGFFEGEIIKMGVWYGQKDITTLFDIDNDCEFAVVGQGSFIDLTGTRTLTCANITYTRQNFYHYNILNGFDYYLDTATGLVPLYVPYVDGAPVVSSVSGYTKQSSNPAGKWHNQAETYVRFPASSIFDKSDVDNWSADLRALATYDSSNPTDWAGYELTPYYFSEYCLIDDIVFSATVDNQYSYTAGQPDMTDDHLDTTDTAPISTVREILVYSVAQSVSNLKKIALWIKTKVGE